MVTGFWYELAERAEGRSFFVLVFGDEVVGGYEVVYKFGDLCFVAGVSVDC